MDLQTIIIFIVLIYTVIISVLYFSELYDRDNYHRNKEMILHDKEDELVKRESIIVDKEICFRELTKMKTIQTSVLDILNSYKMPNNIDSEHNLNAIL